MITSGQEKLLHRNILLMSLYKILFEWDSFENNMPSLKYYIQIIILRIMFVISFFAI